MCCARCRKSSRNFPNLVYIILGATHPNLVREHGEAYRLSLERLAQDLGIKRHVSFYNRFVEFEELTAVFLGVCGYLYHALSQRGAKHLRHAGLRLRQRQGGDLHALLARAGTSRRRIAASWCPSTTRRPWPARFSVCCRMTRNATRCASAPTWLGREMTWSKTAEHYMASFEYARRSPTHHSSIRRLEVKHARGGAARAARHFAGSPPASFRQSTGIYAARHSIRMPDFHARLLHRR